MRKIWKPEDIFGGMYFIKMTSPLGSENLSFAATVTFKVGYDNYNKFKRYGKINCLTDGWYCPLANTKEEFAEYLNSDKFGYRKLTKEEYLKIISHDDQGFTDNF